MRGLFFIFILFFLVSCSAEKKISRAIKKNGAKEVATYIVKNYPEYLKADTLRIDSIIIKEVIVEVPEIIHDTTIITEKELCDFHYKDKNLTFDITKGGNVNYNIHKRSIKDTVYVPIKIDVPASICPSDAIVEELRMQLFAESNKKNIGKWFLVGVIVGVLLGSLLNNLFKQIK